MGTYSTASVEWNITGPALQAGPAVRWAVPIPFLVRYVARDLLDTEEILQAKGAQLAPIAAVLWTHDSHTVFGHVQPWG